MSWHETKQERERERERDRFQTHYPHNKPTPYKPKTHITNQQIWANATLKKKQI